METEQTSLLTLQQIARAAISNTLYVTPIGKEVIPRHFITQYYSRYPYPENELLHEIMQNLSDVSVLNKKIEEYSGHYYVVPVNEQNYTVTSADRRNLKKLRDRDNM